MTNKTVEVAYWPGRSTSNDAAGWYVQTRGPTQAIIDVFGPFKTLERAFRKQSEIEREQTCQH